VPEVALVTAGVEHDVLAEKLGYVRPNFCVTIRGSKHSTRVCCDGAQNGNDRAWRSGAREPFSTPPVLDRSFGSMAEQ
jgi:hypothetical protein